MNFTLVISELHIQGLAGWFLFWAERLFLDRSEFLPPGQLQARLVGHGFKGTTHDLSRLEYIYIGQKPGADSATSGIPISDDAHELVKII